MKKLIYILLLAVSFTSCNFLDTTIYNNPEGDQVIDDENGCMAGLTGIYDILGNSALYGQNLWADLDAGTDIMYYNRDYGKDYLYVCMYNYNNTEERLNETWKALYTGIDRANDFLAQLANLTDSQCGGSAKKTMYEAEARALRALLYMNLVAYWGEVPLRTTPTKDLTTQLLKKSPQADIYAQIFEDLQYGAGIVDENGKVIEEGHCLPANELNAPGRISRTTAQGLLARAYLWYSGYPVEGNTWKEARGYAKAVMNSGLHDLNRTSSDSKYANGYPGLFIKMCSNQYDLTARESMFEVEFYGNGLDASNEAGKVGLYNGVTQSATYDPDVPFAYGWYNATHILLRLYDKKYGVVSKKDKETGDQRKWWNLADFTWKKDEANKKVYKEMLTEAQMNTDNRKACPGKWRAEYDPIRPWARNNSSINFPILRYSDILLMFAEADNEINGPTPDAIAAINEVRTRAGASAIASGEVPPKNSEETVDINTPEGMRQFIFEERTRELCFETPRHMELRRMGKDFFYNRIKLLVSTDVYANGDKHIIGYPLDDVASVPARNIDTSKHIYLPIPQCELNTNTICGQNEGW